MQRRTLLHYGLAGIAPLGSAVQAGAQPLRLIVPYAVGGPVDQTARILATQVQPWLGPVQVENRAGAGGNWGANAVAKAVPDGLTLGIAATATHAINPWLYRHMPYDAAQDFAAVTQILRVPNVLVMHAARARQLRIEHLDDFLAYARSHPDKLRYGSGGNGSAGHLAGVVFQQQAGLSALHVPYRGALPAQLALLADEVDFNIDNLAAAASNIRAGQLRALAVTSTEASPHLPGVPPLAQRFKGFSMDSWWGLVAPTGTPAARIAQLHRAFVQALQTPATRAQFAALWAQPQPSTPAQFEAFMAQERARYQPVVQASGIQL